MGEWEIIGALVIGSTALLGLFGVFMKLIITPINELTVSVARLNASLEKISDENSNILKIVSSQGERIGKLELSLARNDIA